MSISAELERREKRLATIAEAKRKIEARAAEQQQASEKKLADRKQKEKQSSKKNKGKPAKPQKPGPRPKDQVNLTDEESRIMPASGGGFTQGFNAQACVDVATLLRQHSRSMTNSKSSPQSKSLTSFADS